MAELFIDQHDRLVSVYEHAQARLLALIDQSLRSGNLGQAEYRHRQLLHVQQVIRSLAGQEVAATRGVRAAYGASVMATNDVLAAIGVNVAVAFGGIHERQVQVLSDQLGERLATAAGSVGRQADDAFRRAFLEQAAVNRAAGQAPALIPRAMVNDLRHQAVTCFIDRRGRRWPLATYARMATRTGLREAASAGMAHRLNEVGHDLVTISAHEGSDPECNQYAGNTYSITGQTAGYEQLPRWPPFHPNCVHVATPAGVALDDYVAALEARLRGG